MMSKKSTVFILASFLTGLAAGVAGIMFKNHLDTPSFSDFASEASVAAVKAREAQIKPHIKTIILGDIHDLREVLDTHLFGPRLEEARKLYPVVEDAFDLNGVYVQNFTPVNGIPEKNLNKVLIHVHGGAFNHGAKIAASLEATPVSATAGMRVVSVDYRLGPEHRFPAASEDIAEVYKALLKNYKPENIGIFGCSAGGFLTAGAITWFDQHHLPQPGAIGIFCAGAARFDRGDSVAIADLFGTGFPGNNIPKYFEGADLNSPLIAPYNHPEIMAKFPATLLISSTRDFAMSPALATHQLLTELDVRSELHIFEGLDHGFFMDSGIPESKLAFKVIARFFNERLGN